MLNGMEFNRYQLAVVNEVEARAAVRTLQKVGVDFIKLHRRISRDSYFGIAEKSKRIGLRFVGHVPITVSPGEASDAGQASIEHTHTSIKRMLASGMIVESDIRPDAELDDQRRRYYRLSKLGRKVLVAETARMEKMLRHARTKRVAKVV